MNGTPARLPERRMTTPALMGWVIAALLPAMGLDIYYGITLSTGMALPLQLLIACPTALALDLAMLRLRGLHPGAYMGDGSALLSAILLCLLLPATTPWYLLIAGVFVAGTAGKHIFGGLGMNLFNPALLAYIVVLLLAPETMQYGQSSWVSSADASDRANTLVALALLAGGLFILARRIISWHLPLAFMTALAIMLLVFDLPFSATTSMLAAFFLITDPVTSPTSAPAKTLYAAAAGILSGLLTLSLHQPAATAIAILLVNMLVPLLDQLMQGSPTRTQAD